MDTLKIVITSLTTAILVLGGFLAFAPRVEAPKPSQDQVGALSGPDIPSPYLSFGGVRQWAGNTPLRTGTSTVCSIQSPAATTTLVAATARLDSIASYVTSWQIGKDPTAFSTTTALASMTFAANATGSIVATSTSGLTDTLIAPNSFINLKLATTSASATFAPVGNCAAVFREI